MKPKAIQKQRQRMRTVVSLTLFLMSCTTAGLMLYFNLNEPKGIQAKNTQTVNVVIVKEQELLTEKSINAPRLIQHPPTNSKTIFVKAVKGENISSSN